MMELLVDPQAWIAVAVELLNIRMRKRDAKPVQLHERHARKDQ